MKMVAKIKLKEDSIYSAKPTLPNYTQNVIGELYEDFYVIQTSTPSNNHLVQTGKFYIREYFVNDNKMDYNDFLIDPQTLMDITDADNPIHVGCDLAREIDLTYYNGEYYNERLHS